jgi:hypothetical protein
MGKGDFELILFPRPTLGPLGLNKFKRPLRALHASRWGIALHPGNYEVSKADDEDDGKATLTDSLRCQGLQRWHLKFIITMVHWPRRAVLGLGD